MSPGARKSLIAAVGCLMLAELCHGQVSENRDASPAFRLVTVSLTNHCAGPALIEQLKDSGFAIDKPEVRYRFFGELPEPVIEAEKLRFRRVILATGEELDSDAIRLAGKTFGGIQQSYSHSWGLDLDHAGQRLMIDLVVNRRQIDDLARVEGHFNVIRGEGRQVILTELMSEEKGHRDENTGATVSYAMRWAAKGRYIHVDLPIPRERVGTVQVLDAEGQPIPFIEPHYYALIRKGKDATLAKLYVEKPEGTPFKLRLTTFEDHREETMPFVIENVRSTAHTASEPTPKRTGDG